ncbi:MAG: STAS domain-containing protein [Streptomycetales bacterium]
MDDDRAVLEVVGEIDIVTAGQLRVGLSDLVAAGGRRVVVDFARVPFCGSAGLDALLFARARVRSRDGWLRLACLQPAVRKMFWVTGLDGVFGVYDTVEEALGSP